MEMEILFSVMRYQIHSASARPHRQDRNESGHLHCHFTGKIGYIPGDFKNKRNHGSNLILASNESSFNPLSDDI